MIILAIGAHPDDIELGCGGTLARHAMSGDEVSIVVLGSGRMGNCEAFERVNAAAKILGVNGNVSVGTRPDNRFDSVDLLNIVQGIEGHVSRVKPDVIYTHHIGDRNIDHRIVADAVFTACRPLPESRVARVLSFEVASSTEWGSGFSPNVFVGMNDEQLGRKLLALSSYPEEMRKLPHPRSDMALVSLAQWRGSNCGKKYAEAFQLVRSIE